MKESAFEALIHSLLYAVVRYKKQIVVAFLLVIVGSLSFWGWKVYQKKNEQGMLAALYRLDALAEKNNPSASADPEAEKNLIEAYREAVEEYGDASQAGILHHRYAKLLLKSGFAQEAIPHFEIFLKTFPQNSPYRGLILLDLADCSGKLNDWKRAKVYLDEADMLMANPQREFVLYELARVEQKLGEKDKAKLHLDALLQDFADSPLADRAREQKLALEESAILSGAETHSLIEVNNRGQH